MAWSPTEIAMEASALATLGWITRIKAYTARTTAADAEAWATAAGAPLAAMRLSKAAIGSGASGDLGTYGGLGISSWIESARTASAFYRLIADNAVRRLPMQSRAVVLSGATAAVVDEGKAIPVSKISLVPVNLVPVKVSGITIQTNEALRNIGSAGQMALNRELLSVASTAVDGKFLSVVATGAPTSASAGVTAVNAYHDLRTALLSVATDNARPYIICAVDVAAKASTLSDTAGAPAFPAMSASGGEMANLPALVSSAVPPGELHVIDAASVAADALAPMVDVSVQGDIEMSTTPTMDATTPTSVQLVSLWQCDLTAIRINAEFGVQALRTTAAYKITAINWG
jgi:HK97 family phage major capsid protein